MKRTYKLTTDYTCSGVPYSLVTNGFGSYFCLHDQMSYRGWYVLSAKNWRMQKIIESIQPQAEGECEELVHQLFGLRRKFSSKAEDVFLTYQKVLLYQPINLHGKVKVTFDHRESYGGNELGRVYAIDVQDDYVLITFRKYDDQEHLEYEHFVGIRGVEDVSIIDKWVQKDYSFDRERGANPEYWVYEGLEFIPKKHVVFSSGETPAEARTLCDIAFYHFDDIVGNLQLQSHQRLLNFDLGNDQLNATASLASYSLQSLHQKFAYDHRMITGVYAGLPWFFQLWSRDELISLGGVMGQISGIGGRGSVSGQGSASQLDMDGLEKFKAILDRHVRSVLPSGMLANRYPHSDLGSIDAMGWLARRVLDFLSMLKTKQKLYTLFSPDELLFWYGEFEKALAYSKNDHYSNGLFSNKFCETWMDTAFNDDGRIGYRIEIQALHYCLYDVIIYLGTLVDAPHVKTYEQERYQFRKRVQEVFLKDYIIDGVDFDMVEDLSFKPNIFLASYVAPDLFSTKDWEKSFDLYLEKLFVDWGGLMTLNKDHPLFQPYYTGEQNKSYHRGDVWYFVNHLAGVSLLRLNKKKYASYVDAMMNATAKDILELGLAGHCSEVSSAAQQRPEACLAQAWSVATFLELVNELKKN